MICIICGQNKFEYYLLPRPSGRGYLKIRKWALAQEYIKCNYNELFIIN